MLCEICVVIFFDPSIVVIFFHNVKLKTALFCIPFYVFYASFYDIRFMLDFSMQVKPNILWYFERSFLLRFRYL